MRARLSESVGKKDKKEVLGASKGEEAVLGRSRQLSRAIAQLAGDRHCRDIVVLELADRSPVARHFVIGTGTSDQQIRSVARELEGLARQRRFPVFGHAGIQQGRWAVIDCVDVVVHLFDEEYRRFYDLELLWGDAPRLDWEREHPYNQNNTT